LRRSPIFNLLLRLSSSILTTESRRPLRLFIKRKKVLFLKSSSIKWQSVSLASWNSDLEHILRVTCSPTSIKNRKKWKLRKRRPEVVLGEGRKLKMRSGSSKKGAANHRGMRSENKNGRRRSTSPEIPLKNRLCSFWRILFL
jgi:hypothetical protein